MNLYLLSGRLKEKVASFPSALFLAHILPPRDSTILLEMNKPNPHYYILS